MQQGPEVTEHVGLKGLAQNKGSADKQSSCYTKKFKMLSCP